ncbi:putative conjugal transfer protein trbB [Candidatus Glomeribacter gigasporarum BEG34]|uniref:Putative conjugal transfer protein trbB n=1 Tax=Candidatus Glomeribacter gigasporarum BEG34 TaxID=1070319 RepID=G2J8B3_9BURK|nr:ATPase, T2SS/T4P/T4SS family [Candidatus Glomeribacter gigasporarum]CCD29010.1 putative conjugal transfer protein trbB [Candidatus Glomeribacter gigasporarum BEG34]
METVCPPNPDSAALPPSTLQQRAQQRKLEGLRRDFGPLCLQLLDTPDVIELMLNPDGRIWIDQLGIGMKDTGYRMPRAQAEKLLGDLAAMLDTELTREKPILEGELPLDGSRFEGLIPPVVVQPVFSIRKRAALVFTLEDYEQQGILSCFDDRLNQHHCASPSFADSVRGKSHRDVIRLAVQQRKNILVIGSTGSGKTTLVNAILHAICQLTPEHRIILIEDTGEIQCAAENAVALRAYPGDARRDIAALLRATMRLRPDRIIVGEVRDGAALALLKMWNTGHPGGLATIHANDCEHGLVRMQQLIDENAGITANPHVIAHSIDLCIFIEKEASIAAGRKVKQVALVERYDETRQKYVVRQI